MKALLTLVVMMMMMMMVTMTMTMAASESTGETGIFGCHFESPFKFNLRDVFDWKLALTECSKPRTMEFCQSQLDNCGQILHKVHGEVNEETYKDAVGYLAECSELLNAHINVEYFPSTLAGYQQHCFSLNEINDMGFSFMNIFPLYRCFAYKVNQEEMDRFTACINGLE